MQGLIGKKLGMTRIFDDDGRRVAVTVIQAGPCVVIQRRNAAKDGYEAVQVGYAPVKESRVPKPLLGRFRKAGVNPMRHLMEFGIDDGEELKGGDTVTVSLFAGVPFVDVTGITKGRGFQGVVKRYNMGGGRMTHGGHSKRRIGAIGQCSYPARVARGKKMPGHMGNARATQQNLRVMGVREDDNVLIVRGAVPGPNGGTVVVRKSIKRPPDAVEAAGKKDSGGSE
ncbi:MAG: 50S ribosomal protein L3 [Kiritimatiellia bacterium]